ncbi:protein of unknown function [Modestobacter italicus]|uniref:Uncharacterized protein n=1 Tax=Modestobacter italicus (strain DSM 44449 / CECT 9708 / BC 501) TaxID=2732864 RepID=I4EX75_MODI5|nr:hypothetical protein [Modestobacter marinus]CCH87988.1 protein of unknown function [Modestobacter marinus]
MPELTPDPTPASTYFDTVEPTWTHADGRRFWRLTEAVQVTVHPNGHIEIIDTTRRTFRVRTLPSRKGRKIDLSLRPDAA